MAARVRVKDAKGIKLFAIGFNVTDCKQIVTVTKRFSHQTIWVLVVKDVRVVGSHADALVAQQVVDGVLVTA